MEKWKDYVIERLLPKQAAALESALMSLDMKKDSNSQDVFASKRSFVSVISETRSKSRLSVFDDQQGLESRASSPIRRAFNYVPKVGFPELQTLILEGNNISSSDIFDVLGALPNLVYLNRRRSDSYY